MFDSHFHLQRLPSPQKLLIALQEINFSGETSACAPDEWEYQESLLKGVSFLRAAYGIHPMYSTVIQETHFEKLANILKRNKNASVGECGLDKRFEGYTKGGAQDTILKRQIALALYYNRPIVFHVVGDFRRIFQMLEEVNAKKDTTLYFHRFSGDYEAVNAAARYNSFFGNPKYPEFIEKRFKSKSRLRIETDADERFINKNASTEDTVKALIKVLKMYATRYNLPKENF